MVFGQTQNSANFNWVKLGKKIEGKKPIYSMYIKYKAMPGSFLMLLWGPVLVAICFLGLH